MVQRDVQDRASSVPIGTKTQRTRSPMKVESKEVLCESAKRTNERKHVRPTLPGLRGNAMSDSSYGHIHHPTNLPQPKS